MLRSSCLRGDYLTEPPGTMSILLITMRLVGLLISPTLFFTTDVSLIFSSTSSPLSVCRKLCIDDRADAQARDR